MKYKENLSSEEKREILHKVKQEVEDVKTKYSTFYNQKPDQELKDLVVYNSNLMNYKENLYPSRNDNSNGFSKRKIDLNVFDNAMEKLLKVKTDIDSFNNNFSETYQNVNKTSNQNFARNNCLNFSYSDLEFENKNFNNSHSNNGSILFNPDLSENSFRTKHLISPTKVNNITQCYNVNKNRYLRPIKSSQSRSKSNENKKSRQSYSYYLKKTDQELKESVQFERIKQQLNQNSQPDCTFRPNNNNNNQNNEIMKEPNEGFRENMSTKRSKRDEKIISQVKETSFSNSSKVFRMDSSVPNKDSIENRLYYKGCEQKKLRENLNKQHFEKLAEEYSFSPKISENSRKMFSRINNSPIHERYKGELHKRNERVINLKKKQYEDENKLLTHSPQISKHSLRIMRKSASIDENTFDRLFNDSVLRASRRRMRNSSLDSNISAECTFSPKVSVNFDGSRGTIDDFLVRNSYYNEFRKLKEKAYDTIKRQECFTFNPKIDNHSDMLMKMDLNRSRESLDDKFKRLSQKDYEKIQERKEELRKKELKRYSFHPKINQSSKSVSNRLKTPERERNPSHSKVVEIEENYSFKPEINRTNIYYGKVKSNYKYDPFNIQNNIQKEIKKVESKKDNIREINNLVFNEQHTFQPKVNKNIPSFKCSDPFNYSGYERFLEQMDNSRKSKVLNQIRANEVFISGEKWDKNRLFTIPKPFNLSSNNKIEENKEKEENRKDCFITFTDKNKEILQMILKD